MEEASSPAIHDRHLKRISQRNSSGPTKSSAKQYTHESVKILESSMKIPDQKPEDPMFKIKMILFMIVSLFLTYQAMKPSRKAPYKIKK